MCFSYLISQFLFLDIQYTEWCFFSVFQFKEAATGGIFQKKVFTKISQISQEYTCFGVSFQKRCRPPATLLKRDSKQLFSCEICEIFKNTYFEEYLRTTTSEFIGNTTLLRETILKKHKNGKTSFQDGKQYNQKQHFEW